MKPPVKSSEGLSQLCQFRSTLGQSRMEVVSNEEEGYKLHCDHVDNVELINLGRNNNIVKTTTIKSMSTA